MMIPNRQEIYYSIKEDTLSCDDCDKEPKKKNKKCHKCHNKCHNKCHKKCKGPKGDKG